MPGFELLGSTLLIAIFEQVPSVNISELGCPHPAGAARIELRRQRHKQQNAAPEGAANAPRNVENGSSSSKCPVAMVRGRGGGEDGRGSGGPHAGVRPVLSLWKSRLVVWSALALLQLYAICVWCCLGTAIAAVVWIGAPMLYSCAEAAAIANVTRQA